MTRYVVDFSEDEAAVVVAGLRAFLALAMDGEQTEERRLQCGQVSRKLLAGKRE